MNWLAFALMTVVTWGVYGILLHKGQMEMSDSINGRYKAFLFVGLAYFLTAVLAPLLLLMVKGASWNYPRSGMGWSLLAGIAGAIGAFCVLLAFGAKGAPPVVMSIVFAGAPLVQSLVSIALAPAGTVGHIKPPFYLGILLAAFGGFLVTYYRPGTPPKPQAPAASAINPAGAPLNR